MHVVIVGGGLAGLSAAEMLLRCRNHQMEVTVLEAKRIVGGRAGSFDDPQMGQTIDYCQHVAMGCCRELIALLKRCDLLKYWQRYSRLEFYHPDFPVSVLRANRWLPAPLHFAFAIRRLNYLSASQKRQVRSALWRLMRTPTASVAAQTADQWLRNQGQSADTIAQFWEVVLVSALGDLTQNVSMAAARKVFVDGFAASKGASDLLVPTMPLSRLFGKRFADVITQLGGSIRCQTPVRRLIAKTRDPDRRGSDQCDQKQPVALELADGQLVSADAVISAVPWHQVSRLVSPEIHPLPAGLSEIPSSPITGVHCWFDRSWLDRPHAVMVGTKVQWVFRDPVDTASSVEMAADEKAGQVKPHYYQLVISASHGHRDAGAGTEGRPLIDQLLSEIHQVFPAARQAKLLRHRVVTDPNAVFSINPDFDSMRLSAETGPSWLHFAGDWTQTGWPATMEGAVISGRLAAASALKSMGVPTGHRGSGDVLEPAGWGWLARRLIVT